MLMKEAIFDSINKVRCQSCDQHCDELVLWASRQFGTLHFAKKKDYLARINQPGLFMGSFSLLIDWVKGSWKSEDKKTCTQIRDEAVQQKPNKIRAFNHGVFFFGRLLPSFLSFSPPNSRIKDFRYLLVSNSLKGNQQSFAPENRPKSPLKRNSSTPTIDFQGKTGC